MLGASCEDGDDLVGSRPILRKGEGEEEMFGVEGGGEEVHLLKEKKPHPRPLPEREGRRGV